MNSKQKTLSPQTIRRIYDLIGKRYNWFSAYEARAKERSLALLDLSPGLTVLNIGVGSGMEHARIHAAVQPHGVAAGIDISPVMLRNARGKCPSPLCQADALHLPFANDSYDRLYASYVFDLMSLSDIPWVLNESKRVLKRGGSIVIVSLTEGVDGPSRALVAAWKAAYAISPITCAGCRPLQLLPLLMTTGFTLTHSEVITQMAVPSEILVAKKGVMKSA